jgi:catechol 2,3-dioxygenase-like lactoylglutathione lyase family enzyme
LKEAIRRHELLFEVHPITDIVEDPLHKVSVVLLSGREGDVPIELVAPLTEDSPVLGFLRRGIHLYHLCYSTKDIEKTLEEARSQNSLLISGPAPARLYGQRRIAFVYTADGYVVEFLEDEK